MAGRSKPVVTLEFGPDEAGWGQSPFVEAAKERLLGAAGSAREVVWLLEASARQAERDKRTASFTSPDREWTREDLYIRGDGGRGEPG